MSVAVPRPGGGNMDILFKATRTNIDGRDTVSSYKVQCPLNYSTVSAYLSIPAIDVYVSSSSSRITKEAPGMIRSIALQWRKV